MAPAVGKLAFTMGILVVLLALVPLPFLDRKSPEFLVDVVALVLGSTFLALVVWDARRQARLPRGKTGTKPSDAGKEKRE